ncbi:MAG: hypothetical protein AB8G05_22815 [Oligoflexales bacterium]
MFYFSPLPDNIEVITAFGALFDTSDRDWTLEYEKTTCAVRIEDEDPNFDSSHDPENYLYLKLFENVSCVHSDTSGFKAKHNKTNFDDYSGCGHQLINQSGVGNSENRYDATGNTCNINTEADEYTVEFFAENLSALFPGPNYEKSIYCQKVIGGSSNKYGCPEIKIFLNLVLMIMILQQDRMRINRRDFQLIFLLKISTDKNHIHFE